ncbi:MAG: hypothetical protein R8N50_02770 [Alphaproteobacteria bacterium]|nr:hypothetical protein [Alphaproteobacteria bacterium]
MNIFIMILVALFMVGYYLIDSPNQTVVQHNTEYAVSRSDLRSVAQCATALHNAQINGTEFVDICTEQNGITSDFVCLDGKLKVTKCEAQNSKKPAFNYVVTVTDPIDSSNQNAMMEILETHYSEAGTFGILNGGMIMSGGSSTRRQVPVEIIKNLGLVDGQLVYLTQFEMPDVGTGYDLATVPDIFCPVGYTKTYRFGRWQCIGYNPQTDCGGDMIWDSDLYECVPDESRKPLCADNQTAIIVEGIWECLDPFPEKSCPSNMVARLNYNTLVWECVTDPSGSANTKKCTHLTSGAPYGSVGATLRVPQTSCTDCERLVVDEETCVSACVPDPARLSDARCYPGLVAECDGPTRAFYFGFPNRAYLEMVEFIDGVNVPFDRSHSQNRRFNCLDCGTSEIDKARSFPPYVAVCK